jgi:hypothetical protein
MGPPELTPCVRAYKPGFASESSDLLSSPVLERIAAVDLVEPPMGS